MTHEEWQKLRAEMRERLGFEPSLQDYCSAMAAWQAWRQHLGMSASTSDWKAVGRIEREAWLKVSRAAREAAVVWPFGDLK